MTRRRLPRHHAQVCIAMMLTLVIARDAFACSCAISVPACQSTWNADAVFLGTVLSIEQIDNDASGERWQSRLVKLSVQRGFIKSFSGTVDIVTGMGAGDCGYQFKVGSQYLVYAMKNPSTGQLSTGICSRTKPSRRRRRIFVF